MLITLTRAVKSVGGKTTTAGAVDKPSTMATTAGNNDVSTTPNTRDELSPTAAVVFGKRERKRKMFWDEQVPVLQTFLNPSF